jgi:hypothetical protein
MSSNLLLTESWAAMEVLRVLHNHDGRIVRLKLAKYSTPKRRGGVVTVPRAQVLSVLESIVYVDGDPAVDRMYWKLRALAETYWAALQ